MLQGYGQQDINHIKLELLLSDAISFNKETITTSEELWVEMYNTEGSENIFDSPNPYPRQHFFSGVPKKVNATIDYCNYNNYDIDSLWIYQWNNGGFDITNIEFLDP